MAEGYVTIESIDNSVIITRRRFDEQTGEEIGSEIKSMPREKVEYYINMRQQQLDDLQELLKVFPKDKELVGE